MPRPWSPSILLMLALVAPVTGAADPAPEPPQPDPVVLAESVDDGTTVELTTPTHESRHSVSTYEELLPEREDDSSTAVAQDDEAGLVCKEYGEVCRKSRQCCAPLRCAFDGYVYYCRY